MANVYRIELLENRLQTLMNRMSSIRETVIVSTDGFVVAANPPPDIEADIYHPTSTPQVAAMAASLLSLGDQTLERLAQGGMHRLVIEGEAGSIIVYPINRNAALAALVDKTTKMGLALHEIARTAGFFADMLPE